MSNLGRASNRRLCIAKPLIRMTLLNLLNLFILFIKSNRTENRGGWGKVLEMRLSDE